MQIENLTKLIDANATLMNVAKKKNRKLLALRDWIAGFEDDDPPTQAQLDTKIAQLEMADLQAAFDKEKAIFLNPDVVVDPGE